MRDPGCVVVRWLGTAAAVAMLGVSSATNAEGVGFGVSVEPLHFASGAGDLLIAGRNSAPISFYVPLRLLPRLQLEPSAAYFVVQRNKANTPADGRPYSFTATAVGLGGLFYVAPPAPAGFYVGARLTLTLYSGTFMDAPLPIQARPKINETDLFFAPVVGGEYAFSRRFAVGAELQLSVAVWGDRSDGTAASADTPNIGHARFATNTVLFVRCFFY